MKESEILVGQQPPQGVFICDHAGRVVSEFSLDLVGFGGASNAGFGGASGDRTKHGDLGEPSKYGGSGGKL